MYSAYMFDSDKYFGVHPGHGFYRTYSSHPTFTPRPISSRDRYHHALAEARSAELEMLEEGIRREEVLLQYRLRELRKGCVERLRGDTLIIPYFADNTASYNHNRLETLRLRLQEEERLAKLEALHRKLLRLEGGRLRGVTEQYSSFRGMPLLEEAGLLHKLGVSKEVGISHPSPLVTDEASRAFAENLNIKHSHSQKLDDLATRLNARRLVVDQAERGRSHQNNGHPPIASAQTHLLEQSGSSALKNETHSYKKKFTHWTKDMDLSGIQNQGLVQPQLFSKAENSKQEKHEKHSPQTSQSLDAILRDQLEKRLVAEHENEVRDTIKAVLNSVCDIWPASAGAGVSSTPTLRPSAKGKEKEHTPSPNFKKLSSSKVADNDWLQIKEIEKQFYALEREFIFPKTLEFVSSVSTKAGSTPATSCLSFTASNQPIRFYEQSMCQLLIRLDLIESQGNEELRNKRKDVVQKVEHALEDLEKEVGMRLKARLASESKRRSVTIEDVTSPDEHLGTKVVSTSSWIAEKADSVSGSPHPIPIVVVETAENLSSSRTQVSTEELTITPRLADEESFYQGLGSVECIAADYCVQEAVLRITPSDVVPSMTDADPPVQPGATLELACSESKEMHAPEGRNSILDTTSVEPADQTQAVAEDPLLTESQTVVAAIAGVPVSADSSTRTRNEMNETERRFFDEETSEISDVESASSDWSEVDVAVAR